MKVLFFMVNFAGYYRNFEPVLERLLERGHTIHLALEREDKMGGETWARELRERHPGLDWSLAPRRKDWEWYALSANVRLAGDYIQTQLPEFHAAVELRRRARSRVPDRVARLLGLPGLRSARGLRAAGRALDALEDIIPTQDTLDDFICAHDPDVVLLAPHLMPGSTHTRAILSAQRFGFPTAMCVASWDNLSSKQLIRVRPDALMVWNRIQAEEAVELHGFPADRIVVTGAQVYDQWFGWPPRPRREFCESLGLDPEGPYLLYAAGALFPAELTEPQWVLRWVEAVRAARDPRLAGVGILIRPHPKRLDEWHGIDVEKHDSVVLFRGDGRMPVDREAKADYFDSIYHSAGVVGINTSAMIEAAIVGREVHTVLVPEFAGSQEGVFHFRYLREVGGGVLQVAQSLDEHLTRLAATLAGGPGGPDRHRGFLEAFVRPHGLERPATDVFVEQVERLAAAGRRRPAGEPTPAAQLAQVPLRRLSITMEAARLGRKLRRQRRLRTAGEHWPAVLEPLGARIDRLGHGLACYRLAQREVTLRSSQPDRDLPSPEPGAAR